MKKFPVMMANDRKVNDSYFFLQKQLEIADPHILEPLSSTLWPRDMPVKTGGGFVENVCTVNVTYGSTGNGEASMIFNNANNIPVMQADFGKDVSKVFAWAQYMSISYVEDQKFQNVALNINETLDKGSQEDYEEYIALMEFIAENDERL